MAAPTGAILPIKFRIQSAGADIAEQIEGTLTITADNHQLHPKSGNLFRQRVPGLRSADISFRTYLATAAGARIFSPTLKLAASGGALAALEELRSFSVQLTMEPAQRANPASPLDRALLAGMRDVQLTATADYRDPASAGAAVQAALWSQYETNGEVDFGVEAPAGTSLMTGTALIDSLGHGGSNEGSAPQQLDVSLSLSTGTLAVPGAAGLAQGIDQLLIAFAATPEPTTVSLEFVIPGEVGSTKWTVDVYTTNLSMTFPVQGGGPIEVSGTLGCVSQPVRGTVPV